MGPRLFLTGATGFIGSSLLRQWLGNTEAVVTILVRPRRGINPRERLDLLLAELEIGSSATLRQEAVRLAEGDLSRPQLGLSPADRGRLTSETTHIIHCGAAARFDLELEDARQINREGTRQILALARECRQLKKLDYIGTAYVAGCRTGPILEDDLDLGQEHNNTYERSKMEAEQLVREAMQDLPIAIHRPTIVLGDSRTGRISPVSAFARLMRLFALGAVPAIPGRPEALMDLIPLDYTTEAIWRIAEHADSLGRCFHICAGEASLTTLGDVAGLASEHLGREPFAIVPPERFFQMMAAQESSLTEEQRRMLNEVRLYAPYLSGGWRFADTNTRDLLGDANLKAAAVGSYFSKMADCIKAQA